MTANSGQFFQNTANNAAGKNTVTSRQQARGGYAANQRNSIYNNSSDSSDDIVRGGDMRRGSAPQMTYDKGADRESMQQTTGHRRR